MKKFNTNFATLLLFFYLLSNSKTYSQWTYGQPFSTSPPSSTWQQVQNRVPVSGNIMFDSLTKPYPTNAWFNLFFLYGTAYPYPGGQGTLGQNKCWVNPYQIGFGYDLINYSNPKALFGISYRPFIIDSIGGTYPIITWNQSAYAFIGTTNPTNFQPAILNNYTELSATIKFTNTTNTNQYYLAPLVRGMPYVTMIYNNVTPGIYFYAPALFSVNDIVAGAGQQFTGTIFKIKTVAAGNPTFPSQTWMLYSSSPITLEFSQNAQTPGLIGISNFTGYLRMAELTWEFEIVDPAQINSRIALLNQYSKFVPMNGSVSANVPASSSNATINFNYTRYNENTNYGDSLLMMALPHHVDILPTGSTTNILNYKALKGTMREVYKNTWTMIDNLPEYSWYPKNGNLKDVPLQYCDSLQNYLLSDVIYFNRQYQWIDIYSAGKTLARLGRLAIITDELIERDPARYASMVPVAAEMRDSLKIFLGSWLNGQSTILPNVQAFQKDSLFYDNLYGGIISSRSYDSLISNNGVDFGSALYNDHHFHYGYLIYAAAAIARRDPQWFTNNNNYYLDRTLDLIRDISNPSRSDNYFALHRYKDWYDGNSWANGMVPYGGGKNQESSTEAINAWYGVYLFGLAMNNSNISNTGALMLAQEIRAVKKYYHIKLPQANPFYQPIYTNQWHTVTNLYQGGIDAHTFFTVGGCCNYYSTGIQVLPVTPVTEQLWDSTFAKNIYDYTPNGLRYTDCFDSTNTNTTTWNWTTINVGVQAIAYPELALNFFKFYGYNRNNYDNGSSPSNVYYWIRTRLHSYGVGINSNTTIPNKFNSYQNYPNPFNPVTIINYELPSTDYVTLKVFDVLGKEVSILVNQKQKAGSYNVEFRGENLSSGIYFYEIQAGYYTASKKMVLIK